MTLRRTELELFAEELKARRIVRRVIRDKVAKLVPDIVLADDFSDRFRDAMPAMPAPLMRQAKQDGLAFPSGRGNVRLNPKAQVGCAMSTGQKTD